MLFPRILPAALGLAVLLIALLSFAAPDSVSYAIGTLRFSTPKADYVTEVYVKDLYGEAKLDGLVILPVGESEQVYVTTTNVGAASGATVSFTEAYGNQYFIPQLAPGESFTKSFRFTCFGEGRYFVEAEADYYLQLKESNEFDNRASLFVSCVDFKPASNKAK